MARVTVEDCVEKIPNRFELVLLASCRAKNIGAGDPITVEKDNDKKTVIALREIEEGTINLEDLDNMLIASFQSYLPAQEYFSGNPELQEVNMELTGQDLYADEARLATGEVIVEDGSLTELSDLDIESEK